MTEPPSLETLELQALDVRARLTLEAAVDDDPRVPRVPLPDTTDIEAHLVAAHASDRALALLFAEVVLGAAMHRDLFAWRVAWLRDPVQLRGEPATTLRSTLRAMVAERNAARRGLLEHESQRKTLDRFETARDVVQSLREAFASLRARVGESAFDAVGSYAPAALLEACESVLASTDDAFRELGAWARTRAGFAPRGDLVWHDRLRTFAAAGASELVPTADRTGIASRWWDRIGLSSLLGRVHDRTTPASDRATALHAVCDRPGERARVVGTPSRTVWGVVDLADALAHAVALVRGDEERLAARLGVDRAHATVWATLGRRQLCDAEFLVREASVDRARRFDARRDLVVLELARVRAEAALAKFSIDALAGERDLPARFSEYVTRALGGAPAPSWAAQVAAASTLQNWGARVIGGLVEPAVRESLRDRFDDDWFRNPRAGVAVGSMMDVLRSHGAVAGAARLSGGAEAAEGARPTIQTDALARWLLEVAK